jgi:ferredoxin
MRIVQVEVQAQRCHGHGRCAVYAPDVFDFDDDGKAHIMPGSPLTDYESEIEQAYKACPEQAITLRRAPS